MPLLFDLSSSSFAIFNIPFLLSSPTRIVIRAKVFEPAFIIIFLKLAKKGREGKREKGNKQWLEQWETKEREEERARIYNTFEFCYVHRSNKRESGLRARSIDRCHASIVWLNFTRESGARSTLELEHTQGLGTEVISPVSDFQSRQWSLLFDDLASRSCSGSVSKKKKWGGVVSNRVASPQRPTKAPSTFDPYSTFADFHYRPSPSYIHFPFRMRRYFTFSFRHLLVVFIYLSKRTI